jgi:hypothetical protein
MSLNVFILAWHSLRNDGRGYGWSLNLRMDVDFGFEVEDLGALQCSATSCGKSRGLVYCLEVFTPQPLNLKFEDLNTTTLQK